LEESFQKMKDAKNAVKRTEILKRTAGDTNEKLENLRLACLDILEDKGGKEALTSSLEKIKEYIDDLDRGNRSEFENIENPGERIKEVFDDFCRFIQEYRDGVQLIESYPEEDDREKIIKGLFKIKEADEGIEEMLG